MMRAQNLSTFRSLGPLLGFVADPIQTMHRLKEDYGDFVGLRLAKRRAFFCFHPDLAQEVLHTKHACFRKSRLVFDRIIPLTGRRGLVQMEGKEGLVHRRLTSKSFSVNSFEAYLARFAANYGTFRTDLRQALTNGSTIDLEPHITRLVLRNALSMVLGPIQQGGLDELLAQFQQINKLCGAEIRHRALFSRMLGAKSSRPIRKLEEGLSRTIQGLMEESRNVGEQCLCAQLFAEEMDREQIEHHLRTFLFAGFETTATSILMLLYLLAKHPEPQAKVKQAVAGRPLDSMGELRAQNYLLSSYKESLRLFPPSWTLAREVIQETQLGLEKLEIGDQVFLGLADIHRHPEFWSKPDAFDPERFLSARHHECAFLAFGGGPRVCIGMPTAYLEACYVVAAFFQDFELSVSEGFQPVMQARVTCHPVNGLPVQIRTVGSHAQS